MAKPVTEPLPTLLDYHPPTDPWLAVIHADHDILVFDKQSGLLSVPGRHPALADSVRLRARRDWPTAEMAHRLDKDTSGVLVLALNKPALAALGRQFEQRTAKKSYVARVSGTVEGESGVVDLPLMTDWENKPRQKIDHDHGRPARTEWQVIAREPNATRLRLTPLTGRTHQLRVHMLAIGHPILGDAFYAQGEALTAADRLQLHAESLEFLHPGSGKPCRFTAPVPF